MFLTVVVAYDHPQPPIDDHSGQVRFAQAKFRVVLGDEDGCCLERGDVVELLEKDNDFWKVFCLRNRRRGTVPGNYLKQLDWRERGARPAQEEVYYDASESSVGKKTMIKIMSLEIESLQSEKCLIF